MASYRAAIAAAALLVAVAQLGSADGQGFLSQTLQRNLDWRSGGVVSGGEDAAAAAAAADAGGVQTGCPRGRNPACPSGVPAPFRTIDGSCAKADGVLGMSGTPYKRRLRPDYADSKHAPRASASGAPLPSARDVANHLLVDADAPNRVVNQFFMEWSQLFAHDVTLIDAPFPIPNGNCCTAALNAADGATDSCARIDVPKDDPFFRAKGVTCLGMQRSGARACGGRHQDQRNMVTHYVDASFVYGSDNAKAKKLRAFEGGRLRSRVIDDEEQLPVDDDGALFAGDVRVSVTVLMSALQTVMLREHNHVADALAGLNPHWDDERLYLEARKIVSAEWQYMTYREWLPWLIGFDTMDTFELWPTESGYSSAYSPHTDPRTANDFATAAYRTFHSLIQNNVWLDRTGEKQGTVIDVPATAVLQPGMLRGVVEGMLYQPSQEQDQDEAFQIRDRMFANTNGIGGDLIAVDIMRGREHGLPGYNEYRRNCGLRRARDWSGFADLISFENIRILQSLYEQPDDVDVYVGALLERHLDTSTRATITSPVFQCIVAHQFQRYKQGDPYFFDLAGPAPPFTLAQLDEIRKQTASKLLCDNVAGLDEVPLHAFINLGVEGNANVQCSELPGKDLSAWREEPN